MLYTQAIGGKGTDRRSILLIMKKTLIACSVLLSSVALAETQTHTFTSTTGTNFNTELQNYLLNVGYKPGDKFSITLTMAGLGNAGTNLFTLIPDSYYVVNQQLQYFALSTSSSSVTTANVGSITFDSTSKVHTYTNVDGQKISLWTQSDTASVGSETSATRTVGAGLTLTVFDDGTNTGVALAYSAAGGHTDRGCKILSVKSEHLFATRALSFFKELAFSLGGMAAARRRAAAMPGKISLKCSATRCILFKKHTKNTSS